MDSGAADTVTAGAVLDDETLRRSRSDDGGHDELWAGVPADILGTVLRLLPCFTDRSAARSACRHWRATSAAGLPPPLPLLAAPAALPKLRLSCLQCPGGTLAAARHATTGVPAAAGNVVSYVGSSGAWLAGVASSRDAAADADVECFLVNALSHEVVRLPDPQTAEVVSNIPCCLPPFPCFICYVLPSETAVYCDWINEVW
ncbi:unnamed protein product [Urochloa humidicola]